MCRARSDGRGIQPGERFCGSQGYGSPSARYVRYVCAKCVACAGNMCGGKQQRVSGVEADRCTEQTSQSERADTRTRQRHGQAAGNNMDRLNAVRGLGCWSSLVVNCWRVRGRDASRLSHELELRERLLQP
jgi:hypothetical protein